MPVRLLFLEFNTGIYFFYTHIGILSCGFILDAILVADN